jgi:hypothetical protein
MGRWWARVLVYGVLLATIASSSYHLAYHHYAGARPDDSEADLGFVMGSVWAAGMSAILMFALAVAEALLWLKRTRTSAVTG